MSEPGEPTPEELENQRKEEKRNELLDQGKGWESLQYALTEGLPIGDDEVFDALDAVKTASGEAESEEEKARLLEERMRILRWRFPDQSDEELRQIS